MKHALVVFALALLTACGAPSQGASSSAGSSAQTPGAKIEISNPWALATPGGVTTAAGYLTIVNHGADADTLLGVDSPRANSVDVHNMIMQDGMMAMRPAGALVIPPGGTLTLAPGGLHLMFNGITAPFAEGDTIAVTLHFDHGGDVSVNLPVRRAAP